LFWGILLLLVPGLALAQEATITGRVTSESTGEPLPGANVVVEGEQIGVATRRNGGYTLNVSPGTYTLRVTFVGYQDASAEVEVDAGETIRQNFDLQQGSRLEKLVVTGLAQEQTQAEASVSVTSIEAADLTNSADFQSVEQLFQGSTSGVTVSKASGNIGSGIRFNVRSGVSLNSDGQPLIFIDGVRINQDLIEGGAGAGGQMISPLTNLDPGNIESIDVLKGASASALYGTEGSDGVVLIKTKSGRQGQDLRVNYSGTVGFQDPSGKFDTDIWKAAEAANATMRQGNIHENRVSVSGSFEGGSYLTSYTNRRAEGITFNNSGYRNNVQTNFTTNPNEQVRLSTRAGFAINKIKRPQNDNNIFGQISNAIFAFRGEAYTFTDSSAVFSIDDTFRNQKFTGSVSASYSPSAISGLEIQATAGGDILSVRQEQTFPSDEEFAGKTDGERTVWNQENRQFNGNASVRYSYRSSSNLSFTSTVGGQFFTESTRTSGSTVQQFGAPVLTNIGTARSIRGVDENIFNKRTAGIFGRQTFSYKDTYNLNVSLRRDFATRLLPGENGSFTAWYPGVRANVRLEQFDFAPDFFSQLKVRGAFGQTGSLPNPLDAQTLRITGTISGFGTGGTISSVGNPNLKAETVTEIEGGIDLGLNNRHTLSLTYFYQETSDSIVDFFSAPSTGLGPFPQPRNVGQITGQGVETSVDLTLLDTDRHRVSFSADYSYRTAEVKDVGGQTIFGRRDRNVIKEGLAPRSFFGFDIDGAEFDENGVFVGPNIVDQNGDRVIDGDDRVKLGNPVADHFGGFRLNARFFENLTLSARAEYQLGQQLFNNSESAAVFFDNHVELDRLEGQIFPEVEPVEGTQQLEPGTEAYREAANRLAELNRNLTPTNFVEDADFLKIREITVAYDFSDLIKRFVDTPIREFRLRFSGQNLFTLTPYRGPDPQVERTGGRGISSGGDGATLPHPRSFTATLSLGL